MKVLLVEDDEDIVEEMKASVQEALGEYNLAISRSRDEAIEVITQTYDFDYYVLDIQLPTQRGTLDAHVEHGGRVYEELRSKNRNMPVAFLTGFPGDDVITERYREMRQEDIWGNNTEEPMILVKPKRRMNEAIEEILRCNVECRWLEEIEIDTAGVHLDLSPGDKRVIRIFARRHAGRVANIRKLTGGLSDARVLQIRVRDTVGSIRINAVCKIGTPSALDAEKENYNREAVRLPHDGYANLIDQVRAGAYGQAGIFFRVAENCDRTLFDVLNENVNEAVDVLSKVREIEDVWGEAHENRFLQVGDIRRLLVSDADFLDISNYLQDIDVDAFERRTLSVNWCTRHGDLHGANVLVDPDMRPALIDFAEVKDGPHALDPVTLELSVFFHPESGYVEQNWPDENSLLCWSDDEKYVAGSPIDQYVLALRDWSRNGASGTREILATAYAYLVRQLKYQDTDRVMAVAIIDSVVQEFRNT